MFQSHRSLDLFSNTRFRFFALQYIVVIEDSFLSFFDGIQ